VAGDRFDVIVVGARCAGSPLATMLARAGLSVCLLDKASFPSDTPSTHGIQPCGVSVLERLGLLPSLLARSLPIDRGLLAFEDLRVEVGPFTEQVGAPMLNLRRITLDELLLEGAASAGVEVRTATAVTDVLRSAGRVTGVQTSAGPVEAGLVIGADGARSTLARLLGAAEYHRSPARRIFVWAYFEGVDTDGDGRVWLGQMGRRAYLASPSDDGVYLAAVVEPIESHPELRRDRAGVYAEGLAGWPELQARLEGATQDGPVRVMSRWHGFFRESAGPGWALVGDAGHFKDPTPGQGISDALRQSEALVAALLPARGDPAATDAALRDWWAWRDRDAWEMYWFSQDMAAPDVAPLINREIQRRLSGDAELANGFLRVLSHDMAPSELFTPRVTLAALSGSLLANRGRRTEVLREAGGLARTELGRSAARVVRRPAALRGRGPANGLR
jgi:2-polyprenyl-6-methoxyphenol hydroxylase-like FAD-dependent oxidoreductase